MTDDRTLRIERVIDAPPDVVFGIWTTPAAMEQWYRDGDGYVARVTEHDFRVGGTYRVEFGPRGEPPFVETGVFLEIDAPRRLVVTESLAGPDDPWTDTTVTVVFEEEDGKTRLVLVHEFVSPHHRDLAGGGWPGFIDRVERLATTREA
jgi:uncharacterized protein YndB with AHSA1/START domain